MLMAKQPRPAIRTLHGWAISVLRNSGAITECEWHGWMQDRADPHARDRALEMARQDPPPGLSSHTAVAQVREVSGVNRRHLPRVSRGLVGPLEEGRRDLPLAVEALLDTLA